MKKILALVMVLAMVAYITDFFIIAFRIMLPVFGAIMITNCVLGIMAKVAPQMHMFSIGVQLKIILGFIVLYLTVILLPEVADFIFVQMRKNMLILASWTTWMPSQPILRTMNWKKRSGSLLGSIDA